MFRVINLQPIASHELLGYRAVVEYTEGPHKGHQFEAIYSLARGNQDEGEFQPGEVAPVEGTYVDPAYRKELERVVRIASRNGANVADYESNPIETNRSQATAPSAGAVEAENKKSAAGSAERIAIMIKALPRRAIVAFAARCARRVQPLYDSKFDREGVNPQAVSYEEVIRPAEMRAARRDSSLPVRIPEFIDLDSFHKSQEGRWRNSASKWAATSAAYALKASVNDSASKISEKVVFAASAAVNAAVMQRVEQSAYGTAYSQEAVEAEAVALSTQLRDLVLLSEACNREAWNDDTPVPPEFFGPLWPNGPPPGWPVGAQADPDTEDPNGLVLRLHVGKFAPEEEVAAEVINLINALSAYHIACGGSGFVIEDWETFVPRAAPVEVS